MGKNQSASNLTNIVKYDNNGNLTFVSGSSTLLSVSSSGALTTTSTITATTLIVQTITSSISAITGSTKFGSSSINTHQFTGSITITGSIYTGGNMGTAMSSIYTASNNMIYLQSSINGIQQANTNNVNSGSILLTNTGGTGAYSIIAHGGSTAGNGLFIQSQDRTAAAYYSILLNPNGGNVGIGTSSPQRTLSIANGGPSVEIDPNGGAAGPIYFNYNRSTSTYTTPEYWALEHKFMSNGGTERLRITSAGELQVKGPGTLLLDGSSNNLIRSAGNSNLSLYASNNGTSGTGEMNFYTADTSRIRIFYDGYIALNSVVFNTTTSGTVRTLYIGTGAGYLIGGISSIRASKKNIENVSNIDWLYQLNPVTFNYRKLDENKNYTEEIYEDLNYGLIAEDTVPVADFLINYNDKEDGTKEMIGIEYPRLIVPLLKAIQELKAEIDELKNNK